VGGIPEKLHGARQAGVKTVYLPEDNAGDIPQDTEGLEVIRVAKMAEILEKMW